MTERQLPNLARTFLFDTCTSGLETRIERLPQHGSVRRLVEVQSDGVAPPPSSGKLREDAGDASDQTVVGRLVRESLIGSMVGSYLVVGLLGRGGVASVYVGEHPAIGARVAIKVLRMDLAGLPEMRARFLREARVTNQVLSPHVVRIQDFGELPDGRDFAIMECLRGLPLNELLRQEGALQVPRALRLLEQVASGLSAAHAAHVIHCDIKPSNIFISLCVDQEHAHILDFGIARRTQTASLATQEGVPGMLVGTPAYCAPEQVLNDPVGPEADVYSLATLGYELLSGNALFTGETLFDIVSDKIRAHRVELTGLSPQVPAELIQLLESMLAHDPDHRPTMMEVRTRLREIASARIENKVVAHGAPPRDDGFTLLVEQGSSRASCPGSA